MRDAIRTRNRLRQLLRSLYRCCTTDPGRFERLSDLANTYRADGIIDFTWIACHTYACESAQIKELAERDLNIPYLHIESDYGDADRGQLLTRLQAFVEML